MKNKGLVLMGGGGHSRAIIDVVEQFTTYSISLQGRVSVERVVEDTRKLTKDDWLELCSQYEAFIVSVGQIKSVVDREAIVSKLQSLGAGTPTIISPKAYVSPRVQIGKGTVIMHNAAINTGARIGDFCIINTGAILEHDAKVGDFCHISTGAVVNGEAKVGSRTFIGSNAVVLNQIKIGSDVVLGAGSVAIYDITEPGIYRGNPAGRIK